MPRRDPPDGRDGGGEIADLLRRLRPDIERILVGSHVAEREAEEILQDLLLMLLYRWERIADPELWLLTALRRSCRRRAGERRHAGGRGPGDPGAPRG